MDDDEQKMLMDENKDAKSSPDPDDGKNEKHCFPYYDFTVSVI